MPVFDASAYSDDLLGWHGEASRRIHDRAVRKSAHGRGKVGAAIRKISDAVATKGIRAALSECLRGFREHRHEPPEASQEALHRRIMKHGRKDTIENYPSYLFTVTIDLGEKVGPAAPSNR